MGVFLVQIVGLETQTKVIVANCQGMTLTVRVKSLSYGVRVKVKSVRVKRFLAFYDHFKVDFGPF